MLDLRRLSHLVALADECHFARAAERVHLSQPAFSRSIQAIESDAGLRLFERDSGNVRPTPAGEFLIDRARRMLFDARCLRRDVELYRESKLGDTAFGVGPFPAATILPRVLLELRRSHPQVGLRVEVNNWAQLLDRLRAEDIEFFVADTRDLPHDAALETRPLGRQRGGFYVRAGHPLAADQCKAVDLWRYGVAATHLPPQVNATFAKLLRLPKGTDPGFAIQCDDLVVLRAVTLSTDTVLAATEAAVLTEVESGELVQVKVEGMPIVFAVMGVVTLRDRSPSPMAQMVITAVERVAAAVNT